MLSSVAVKAGRSPQTNASRATGSKSTSPILIRGVWLTGGLRCSARPGQQLAEVEQLDQVVVGASVQPGDPVGGGVPRGGHRLSSSDLRCVHANKNACPS